MKILILRFSSIGDIILTTPIVRCLKLQLPNIEIHYLTKTVFSNLLTNNLYIDKVHCYDNNLNEIIHNLKKENFDYIIDLHNNIRTAIVKFRLLKPSSTFNKLNFKKWLIVNFKINLLPDIHVVDRYFKTLEKLNIKNDKQGIDFFIPEEEKVDINLLPHNFHNGFITLVVGGKHTTKQLPEAMLINLCKKTETPIVLMGGKEDRDRAENIRNSAGNHNVFNACGIFSIHQSSSIIEQSLKIITADTGLMHIASAFKKEIISVWGNTIPEFGMYPYLPENEKYKSEIIQVVGLKCRPCSKIGFKECPERHFDCMNKIDTNQLLKHFKND
ncbi:MAG: glycosyltransferase family 9 protein [Bacteroidetes bacterium]|nr:glycosyltransferase family 9 protein [Bacteroidota bacterium]